MSGRLLRWLRGDPAPSAPPAPPQPPPATITVTEVTRPDSPPGRRSLRELLARRGPLPVDAALDLAVRLCSTALKEEGPRRLRALSSASLIFTETADVAGITAVTSLDTLSPEEVRGLPTDARSDTFTVTLVLVEALRGVRAYEARSELEVLTLAMEARIPQLPAELPLAVSALITRGLAREPNARFQTLEELHSALLATGLVTSGALARVLEGHVPTPPALPAQKRPATTADFLLERIAHGDEGARLVYADHLEAEGRPVEAAWVREEVELRRLTGDAQLESLNRLRALQVTDAFMAAVARPPIEACAVQFGFRCPRTWDSLQVSDDPKVRWCSACREPVHFAMSVDEAVEFSRQGRCVTIAPTEPRRPGDVQEELQGGYTGRRATPLFATGRRR